MERNVLSAPTRTKPVINETAGRTWPRRSSLSLGEGSMTKVSLAIHPRNSAQNGVRCDGFLTRFVVRTAPFALMLTAASTTLSAQKKEDFVALQRDVAQM